LKRIPQKKYTKEFRGEAVKLVTIRIFQCQRRLGTWIYSSQQSSIGYRKVKQRS